MLKNFFGLIGLTLALAAVIVFIPSLVGETPGQDKAGGGFVSDEDGGNQVNSTSSNCSEIDEDAQDCHHKTKASDSQEEEPVQSWAYIQSFMGISQDIKVEEDCHIGVGYTQNLDWNIEASKFFEIYEGEDFMNDLVPTEHAQIDTHKKFVETFLYFFQDGISAERVTANPQVIKDIMKWLVEKNIAHTTEVGGHAPKFAERIEEEGCKAFFIKDDGDKAFKDTWEENEKVQTWTGEIVEDTDDHICILYHTGEKHFGYESPRANRFYFIYDPKGSKFENVEKYHEDMSLMGKDERPERHMFAGYQYSEGAPKEKTRARFEIMEKKWAEMKEDDPEHTIHVELAHFNLDHTLHFVIKHLFSLTDSLGLNEHEMYSLLNQYIFYHNRDHPEEEQLQEYEMHNSRLTVNDSLNMMNELITKHLTEEKNIISRIQYHTLGHMITWYDPEKWKSGDDSLFRSGYTSANYCNMLTVDDEPDICKSHTFEKLNLQGLPEGMETIEHEFTFSEEHLQEGVRAQDLIQYLKMEGLDYVCGVVSTPTCKDPSKLTGLGDNISSTGFTYQSRIFT